MYNFNLFFIFPYLDSLQWAIWNTLQISVTATFLSIIFGVLMALVRLSNYKYLRLCGVFYVEVVRNMPMVVLLYLIFFGLPSFGIVLSGYICGLTALTMNSTAFMTEIFRSGFMAVSKGQFEAARAQGMTNTQVYCFIILPQVFRISYASLGNQIIGVIMGSSIMMIATIEEVTAWMFNTGSINFRYFEVFFVGGLVYFVLCQTVNLVRNAVGKIIFKTAAAGGPW